MFVPDTTAFATEFIARSWGYGQAGGEPGPGPAEPPGGASGRPPYFDAQSVLGSFRSGFSSFAAATAASLRDSVPRPAAAGWGGRRPRP